MNEAPIFVRSFDLHSWLLDRLDRPPNDDSAITYASMRRDVLVHSRALLEAVSLALARFDLHQQLIEADEHLTLLRVHLRMAADKEVLSDRQLAYAASEIADIGRQIGGWRRKVESVE